MDRKQQVNVWYLLAAMLALLFFQSWWIEQSQVETLPYSQFVKLLEEGGIDEMADGVAAGSGGAGDAVGGCYRDRVGVGRAAHAAAILFAIGYHRINPFPDFDDRHAAAGLSMVDLAQRHDARVVERCLGAGDQVEEVLLLLPAEHRAASIAAVSDSRYCHASRD